MTTTCLLDPADFATYGTMIGPHRKCEWTYGVMAHIIAALDGQPVAIVVDNATGHMPLGVKLVGLDHGSGGYRFPHVIVEYSHGPNCTEPLDLPDGRVRPGCPRNCPGYHRTAHLLFKVGAIVPMERDVKWQALASCGTLFSNTLPLAKEALRGGGLDWYAKWTGRIVSLTAMTWSAESQVRPGTTAPDGYQDIPRGADKYWTIDLAHAGGGQPTA